jgi:hypothetical protein
MTALRFRARHVHRTVYEYVIGELTSLGWPDAATAAAGAVVNFGSTPVTVLESTPDANGVAVAANTLVITVGDEPAARSQELGDGLRMIAFPVYVDIFGANQGIATSIASDVKTLFENRYMYVTDFTADPPVPSQEYLEFDSDDVSISRPPVQGASDFRRYWRIVNAVAQVYYIPD